MKPVKMGVIGVGGRGRGQVRQLVGNEFVQIVAVADVVKETVDQVAKEYGVPGYTSHQALCDQGDVEAVFIATPHLYHAPVACDVAARGIHILCEKPIAVSVSEADRMIDAANRAGVLLGVMFQERLAPHNRKAKEIIESGLLGDIWDFDMVCSGWYRNQAYYGSAPWRATWKADGGGVIGNQAPHDLDLWQWMCGLPRTVSATLRTRVHRIEVENTVHAIMDYAGSKVGTFRATTADPAGANKIEVLGEKGRIVVERGKVRLGRHSPSMVQHIEESTNRREGFAITWEDVTLGDEPRGHAEVVAQFARALRTGASPVATGEDGLKALELANAMYLSGFNKSPVAIPVDRAAIDQLFADLRDGRRKLG